MIELEYPDAETKWEWVIQAKRSEDDWRTWMAEDCRDALMVPASLEYCVDRMRRHFEPVQKDHPMKKLILQQSQFRILNVKTGEVVPFEILGIL